MYRRQPQKIDEPPKPKPRKTQRINSVKAYRILKAWREFMERLDGKEPDADELHAFCCAIAHSNQFRLEPCQRCSRFLTTRQRYRACIYCGHTGNWRLAEDERKGRQGTRAADMKHRQLTELIETEKKRNGPATPIPDRDGAPAGGSDEDDYY